MTGPEGKQSHFRTIQRFQLDYAPVNITQYESRRTGMRAVVVDQKGPKISGYFALATEILDDSGAPHTLEHLCFLGSRSYRYKGLLDKLATRAYSTTNAWTATDQTAYTLVTAGWEGFAQILPVYLEHLILPTLTDAGCYTEVHHIDGTGHDAGVVYSEMQGVQNSAAELIDLQSKRLLYPEGNGFRYETGGMMEALRVLTADCIRQFHRDMYQPKNMCLVITGEVDHENLLSILDTFEGTILEDIPALDAPFKRPWTDSKATPPLNKTTIKTVNFPEEDESIGEILTCWFGPSCNDAINSAAFGILLSYLAGSSVSVLENTLVEREQVASAVYYQTDYRPDMVVSLSLTSVETARLAEVEKRLIGLIHDISKSPLDMDYMQDCINRFGRQIKLRSEDAGDFFCEPIIVDHLFGDRDGRHLRDMATLKELDELVRWTDGQWRDFISKWLVDAHHISILGVPSADLSEKLKEEEKTRVKSLQEKLGEAGLKRLSEKLERARAENDEPIPDALLEKFPVPSTDSVHFIPTITARSGTARKMGVLDNDIQRIINKDDDGSPLFIHFEHIPSNFVRIKVDIGTASVPVELKPLISVYMMTLFATPVNRDGRRMEFEDLVTNLERDTVSYGIYNEGANAEILSLLFEVEPELYERVITWIRTVLFDAIHDPERLHASLTKMLADIPDEKRSGHSMLSSVAFMVQYEPQSTLRATSTLSKALYLRRVRKLLALEPESVIDKYSRLCQFLNRPENFRIKVAANIETLPKPVTAWRVLTSHLDLSQPLEPIPSRKALLSEEGRRPGSSAYIVPIAAIDSSFAMLVSNGPDSYEHPDLPALLVAVAYMDAVEGPLWNAVRGQGLAYGTGFARSTDAGLFSFSISRSPDAFRAYRAAKEQIEGYANGKLALNRFELEGAVSSIVLGIADDQPTMSSAADASFVNQVIKNISKDWAHRMLLRVREVSSEQIREVMAKYMLPIFDPASANLFVTCAQIMSGQLADNFSEFGFKVETRSLEDFQDGYGLQAPVGDDGDEGDEDEDEDEDDDEAEHTPESDFDEG